MAVVIEHAFVSTRPQEYVLAAAEAYLRARGFEPSPGGEGAAAGRAFEMRRGESKAHRARTIAGLPQRVSVEYDRGRVAVAATIEPSAKWGGGGSGSFTLTSGGVEGRPKHMVVHEQLLRAIVTGLQTLLAHDASGTPDYAAWDAAEAEAEALEARRKRRNGNALLIALAIVAALVVAAILATR
ncbi:MAG TPA: hypothetical protein VF624_11925 [Tepidisphaeraceae bacterium]